MVVTVSDVMRANAGSKLIIAKQNVLFGFHILTVSHFENSATNVPCQENRHTPELLLNSHNYPTTLNSLEHRAHTHRGFSSSMENTSRFEGTLKRFPLSMPSTMKPTTFCLACSLRPKTSPRFVCFFKHSNR